MKSLEQLQIEKWANIYKDTFIGSICESADNQLQITKELLDQWYKILMSQPQIMTVYWPNGKSRSIEATLHDVDIDKLAQKEDINSKLWFKIPEFGDLKYVDLTKPISDIQFKAVPFRVLRKSGPGRSYPKIVKNYKTLDQAIGHLEGCKLHDGGELTGTGLNTRLKTLNYTMWIDQTTEKVSTLY